MTKKNIELKKKRYLRLKVLILNTYRIYSIDSYRLANQSRYTICIGSVDSKDEFIQPWSLKVNKSL